MMAADQRLRCAAYLRHCAGRTLDHIGPHGLDRVDDDDAWRDAFRQSCDDVFDGGFGGELDRGVAQAQPLGAQAHLRHRLFAGDVDSAVACPGHGTRRLDQQCRFSNAGVATHQQHRTAYQAAAGDTVEFGDAGR
jgi:hypothetical protein